LNSALRNQGVLILGCVLVAFASLLCVGKESQAKQPVQAPKAGGQATSHQPKDPRPTVHRPAAQPNSAQPNPAPREPVGRTRSSRPEQRPTKQRGAETATPASQRGPARSYRAEPPGRQVAPHEKPVHKKQPVQEQKPAHERPGLQKSGRGPGPQKPVGPDHVRQHPRPEKVDRGQPMRPVHERPVPMTPHPRGNESTGQQKGPESPARHSGPASPPGKENAHPEGRSFVAPSEEAPQRPEHGMAAGPEKGAGNATTNPVVPEKKSPASKSPAYVGPSTSHKAGVKTTPGVNPSYRQAGTEGGYSGSRPAGLRREEPARVAEPSPASAPDHGVIRSSQTAVPLHARDAVPAAPRGGRQSPAGAQVASETPFGATKFLFDPLWDERSSLVDLSKEALRRSSGSPRVLATGTLDRGSLTQRGPPLELPQPVSGFIQVMGGAAFGSGASGNGAAPLLAVIVVCLVALHYQGWFRIFCVSLRPGTVYRPVLERPG
jgi:hypothetical protein